MKQFVRNYNIITWDNVEDFFWWNNAIFYLRLYYLKMLKIYSQIQLISKINYKKEEQIICWEPKTVF